MAMLRLSSLLEDAAYVASISKIDKLKKQLKLKYIQAAMDGNIYESSADKHYLYFTWNSTIYRIGASKVPVT